MSGFTSQRTKAGGVRIARDGRQIVTLGGRSARVFLGRVEGLDAEHEQLLLARMTGNYKRGNERAADLGRAP